MHPEEVVALNEILKQERALRKLIDETKRSRNYSLGVQKFERWLTQTRFVLIENISEVEGYKFYTGYGYWRESFYQDDFMSRTKEKSEALAALRQSLQENGLASFRSLPTINSNDAYDNEKLHAAHTAIRQHIHELIRYEIEYYADENEYQRAYQRIARWKQRTQAMLVITVSQQEAEQFAEAVKDISSISNAFETGKAFLNALLVLQRHLSCSSVPRRVRSRPTKLPLAGRSPVRTSKCRCSTRVNSLSSWTCLRYAP